MTMTSSSLLFSLSSHQPTHPPTHSPNPGTRVGLSACAFLDYATGLSLSSSSSSSSSRTKKQQLFASSSPLLSSYMGTRQEYLSGTSLPTHPPTHPPTSFKPPSSSPPTHLPNPSSQQRVRTASFSSIFLAHRREQVSLSLSLSHPPTHPQAAWASRQGPSRSIGQ